MKHEKIRLRKSAKDTIFPCEYTKLRGEDFVTIVVKYREILNEREQKAIIETKVGLSKGQHEFFARKTKTGIELISLDEDVKEWC